MTWNIDSSNQITFWGSPKKEACTFSYDKDICTLSVHLQMGYLYKIVLENR